MADTAADILIRIAEVERQVSLTRSAIYRRMRVGTFPLAVDLGGGQVRWWQSEIIAWKRERPRTQLMPPPQGRAVAAER
ncbi:helix-turn-helix transcriptional regulator [Pararoseomonas indoligenes]|uniref:AlpA family phage regulatory protein n=1 Tax=Roseomonas indoligenes TaxID=2820811 RepID=A0A940S5K7_9PROT|nr:AlpA family phage regulatory protein [Pararoseomonas indoligenes]MBP0493060.1 AlpA family phage regulatory protein [Pararoseomonas indoligenes]